MRDPLGTVAKAFHAGWLASHPVTATGAVAERSSDGDYSDAEAAAVEAHLKDLGYIE